MITYQVSLSLECPYCKTRCQFHSKQNHVSFCSQNGLYQDIFVCTHCGGLIISVWQGNSGNITDEDTFRRYAKNRSVLIEYFPVMNSFKSCFETKKIPNEDVRKDYEEAIDCFNNGFYNASMVMARRAIHQELDAQEIKGSNLYAKINSLPISDNLKTLLQKVKNFGNSGAHPDFFLYDDESNKLIPKENERDFAEMSLKFLDKYFQDQYELEELIKNAPLSDKEKTE